MIGKFNFKLTVTAWLFAALVLGAAGQAAAQEVSAEHLEAARAAVAASKSTQSLDSILIDISEKAKSQLITNRPDAAEKINEIVDEVALSMAGRRGDLENEVAIGYANVFTIEELNQITEFYHTPAGEKLIRETPVVARSINQAARVWTNGIQRDLQQEVQKRLEAAGLK